MAYTYDDFLSAVNGSGLYGEFSREDLDLAKKYPEFGMSILSLKKGWHNASTDEERERYNQQANALRSSYGNYSGGVDGGGYVSGGKIPGQIDSTLDAMQNYGSFDFGAAAPSYSNQYAQQQKELLDRLLNRGEFTWSKEADPNWSAYKKEFLREGDRATANALAQASAASGGRPSSYAMTTAGQAGDYYAGKLADKIPELYQNAYQRYLNEYSMMQQDLSAVNQQEQLDYQKYLDQLGQWNTDRSFAYGQYLDDYGRLQSNLAALQGQDAVDYSRYQDMLDRQWNTEQRDYERAWNEDQREYERAQQAQALAQQERSFYQDQLDAILSAGGSPSAGLVGQSGYSDEYVSALRDYYRRKAEGAGSSGGGSSGRSSSGGNSGGADWDGLYQAAMASGHPQSYIANNYKQYGFSSSSGLYNDYKTWVEGQNGESGGTTSGDLQVDMESVLELGYGPINAERLDELVRSGLVEEYEEDGRLRFRKVRPGREVGIQPVKPQLFQW